MSASANANMNNDPLDLGNLSDVDSLTSEQGRAFFATTGGTDTVTDYAPPASLKPTVAAQKIALEQADVATVIQSYPDSMDTDNDKKRALELEATVQNATVTDLRMVASNVATDAARDTFNKARKLTTCRRAGEVLASASHASGMVAQQLLTDAEMQAMQATLATSAAAGQDALAKVAMLEGTISEAAEAAAARTKFLSDWNEAEDERDLLFCWDEGEADQADAGANAYDTFMHQNHVNSTYHLKCINEQKLQTVRNNAKQRVTSLTATIAAVTGYMHPPQELLKSTQAAYDTIKIEFDRLTSQRDAAQTAVDGMQVELTAKLSMRNQFRAIATKPGTVSPTELADVARVLCDGSSYKWFFPGTSAGANQAVRSMWDAHTAESLAALGSDGGLFMSAGKKFIVVVGPDSPLFAHDKLLLIHCTDGVSVARSTRLRSAGEIVRDFFSIGQGTKETSVPSASMIVKMMNRASASVRADLMDYFNSLNETTLNLAADVMLAEDTLDALTDPAVEGYDDALLAANSNLAACIDKRTANALRALPIDTLGSADFDADVKYTVVDGRAVPEE